MRIEHDVIDADEIAVLKQYWNDHHDKSYVNGYSKGWHPFADMCDYVDKRLLILPNTAADAIIKKVVDRFLPGETMTWANYQRQALPHTLHVDEYGRDRTNPTWTIIIAVDTEPRFKTLIFKESFNHCLDLERYINRCRYLKSPFLSDIGHEQDIEHMQRSPDEPNVCNYFTYEGAFEYRAGSMCLFDTNVVHCGSNWVKYDDLAHRDLVQIHIGQPSPNSYNIEDHTAKGDPIPDRKELVL